MKSKKRNPRRPNPGAEQPVAPVPSVGGLKGPVAIKKSTLFFRIRLTVLIAIMLSLGMYTYVHLNYVNTKNKIVRAIASMDDSEALVMIRRMEKSNGPSSELYFLRARAYRHLGDDVAFLQNLELARQLGYPIRQLETEKLMRVVQLDTTGEEHPKLFEQLLLPETDFDEAAGALVFGLLANRQFEEIFGLLNLWQKQNKDSPWIPYFYGMIAVSNRDWPEALGVLEPAVKQHPDFVPFYKHLGFTYRQTKNVDGSIESFKRYLKSISDDSDSVCELATAYLDAQRNDEALELLQPWLDDNKATAEMKFILGRLYLDLDEPQKLIDILGPVSAIWPEDGPINSLLSRANQKLGNEVAANRYAKAFEASQKDLLLIDELQSSLRDPNNDTAQRRYELGHILLHKKSREEGRYWLNLAITKDNSLISAHEDLVTYFTRINRNELAQVHQRYIDYLKGKQ